jgi:UDP-N-acetylmuramoylalanine--D-glutamate ligase
MNLAGRTILVVGLARSGVAAARFLARRGARVRATDAAPADRLGRAVAELGALGVELELGGHRPESFTGADLIVISPGVPHRMPLLDAARAAGVPVIGELELAARFIAEPIVAVTGTNGKTTVTELIGAMLAASGRRVFVGGNIGAPLIGYADGGARAEALVVEVSSFQLDTIETFRPRVGVLLNITDDHLDRYPDFESYARSKMRLFENQRPTDTAVLNAGDAEIRSRSGSVAARVLAFNAPRGDGAAAAEGRTLRLRLPGRDEARLDLGRFRLRGPHNRENAAAAALAARCAGASPEGIQAALDGFAAAPHRLETVATVAGVEYVNDSKATNVDAVRRGLESFDRPVVLVMGGQDKGGDFRLLADAARTRAKALVLVGGAREAIRAALGGILPAHEAADMDDAVRRAAALAAPGDAVLLAPGCASFDRYANYQERGEDFRRAVGRLAGADVAAAAKEPTR